MLHWMHEVLTPAFTFLGRHGVLLNIDHQKINEYRANMTKYRPVWFGLGDDLFHGNSAKEQCTPIEASSFQVHHKMHEIPSTRKIITRSTCSYSCGQSRSWPCPPCGWNTWQCWTEIQFHSICSKPVNIEDNRLILGQPQPLLHHPAKIWRWHFSKIWSSLILHKAVFMKEPA